MPIIGHNGVSCMENNVSYLLPPGYDLSRLYQQLEDLYLLEETGEQQYRSTYLDTWDWRLVSNGVMVERAGYKYTFSNLDGAILASETGSRKPRPLLRDFPQGALREHLAKCMDVRALLPQFTVETAQNDVALLNKDQKTVLRFSVIRQSAEHGDEHRELQPLLILKPLRGYNKPKKKVVALLRAEEFRKCGEDESLMERLHQAFGVDRSITSSKFSCRLSAEASIAEAVQQICIVLKEAMLRNLSGTLEDIDSEFLHDFRVAVRRTRSLLSLLKKYLPQGEVRQFQEEFKWLGTVTGPVRDLDVYLLMTDQYQGMLPVELQPGLKSFFLTLASQRKKDLRQMKAALQSERFSQLIEGWQQFLELLPDRDDYPAGAANCREVAEKIIRKRFKRILKEGGRITPETGDEKLHELRIEGKKFRYMLEFFCSIFAEEATLEYLKQMKKLQNNLGDFNDYSVQREVLLVRLQQLKPTTPDSLALAAALGGLIVHMGDAQQEVRTKFEQTFQNFAAKKNIDLLEQIFAGRCEQPPERKVD